MLIKKLNVIISDLPLAQQFALTGVKLQCLVAKHIMSGTLFIQRFFVLCPRLDATNVS